MDCSVVGIPFPCFDFDSLKTALLIYTIKLLFPTRNGLYPKDQSDVLKNGDEFDFIVVGAGSAGSVVAGRLAEHGQRVLVLEAGGYPSPLIDMPATLFLTQQTEEDWSYKTKKVKTSCGGLKGKICKWPRGKVLGGCGSTNAMLYIRGNKRDYDNWANLGNKGWSYEEVLPYFQRLEKITAPELLTYNKYGKNGNFTLTRYVYKEPVRQHIIDAWKELGYEYDLLESNIGLFDSLLNIKDGIRVNPAWAFLGPNKDRINLVLSLKSHVTKVLIDKETAKGVEVLIDGKLKKFYASKEVILSGGVVNSPQMLLLSGVGPKEQLHQFDIKMNKNLKGVGENLQDHLVTFFLFLKFNHKVDEIRTTPFSDLFQYYRHKTGEMSQIRMINFVSFINTKKDSDYPNVQIMHAFFPKGDEALSVYGKMVFLDRTTDSLGEAVKNNTLVGFLINALNPKSVGRVYLNSSDPLDHPIIHTGYLEDEEDEQTLLEGIHYVEKLLETESFKELDAEIVEIDFPECKHLKFRTDQYWKCLIRNYASTIYHPVGTCKMGPNTDAGAVVDERLRVHGVKNLRIVDASVMPKIVSANTVAATMMIAEKGVDMILNDNNHQPINKETKEPHNHEEL